MYRPVFHFPRSDSMATPLYLELHELASVVTLAPATIQRLVRQGEFPAPRQLSPNRVGWLHRELVEWSESRPVSTLPPPPNTSNKNRRTKASD
jgi:prophage regulatory protein